MPHTPKHQMPSLSRSPERLWRGHNFVYVLVALWALPIVACSSGGTPKGMSQVTEPSEVTANVVGGAAAAQTGAPEPQAPGASRAQAQSEADASQAVQAAEIYAQRCVLCHGPKGLGNGVAAENLRPKPRNLRDPAWQTGTTDAEIAAIILKGGANVGKSMMMPANPDLTDKPKVTEALVRIVRGFAK